MENSLSHAVLSVNFLLSGCYPSATNLRVEPLVVGLAKELREGEGVVVGHFVEGQGQGHLNPPVG